jgi:glycosyltransferase involved in cell wall biosynthesis
MKLADRSLKHHIYPISLLKEVDEILLVRDRKGPKIEKVKYYCPPKWTLKVPVMALFFKFLLMIYLSIREKPTLVHAYLLLPHGILAFITGKLTRRKVGISLIAGPVELYTSGSPVEKYTYTKSLPKLSLTGKIMLGILKRFDVITTTGSFTTRFLVEKRIDENKIFILPHVVDERFEPVEIKREYDIIYVGRLAPVKHVETLIKAISIVKKSNPDITVAIAGDGSERNKLEELSIKMNVTENIFFAGFQSDVWNWYNKAKISVLTSEREGFPYSVVESLSCGVPVIASNCGDMCDVLKDGYNGVIIEDYQDYESFATAIVKLLQNPQIITEYSNNALKTAENLTVEKAVLVWEGIIHKISDCNSHQKNHE